LIKIDGQKVLKSSYLSYFRGDGASEAYSEIIQMKYTDRARKVIEVAEEEARRFNHEYIGTEHILLGLLKIDYGVGGNVLKNLTGSDLIRIKQEVEKLVIPNQSTSAIDKTNKLPITPRARKILGDYAYEEARNLGHNYVGTEHILLGIIRESEGVGAQVLMNFDLKLEDVRYETKRILGDLEQKLTPESSQQMDYWHIPKSNMSLDEVLGKYGFAVRQTLEQNVMEEIRIIILGREKSKRDNLIVGQIKEKSKPTIFYDNNNPGQLEETHYLKEVLDVNNQTYEEFPLVK